MPSKTYRSQVAQHMNSFHGCGERLEAHLKEDDSQTVQIHLLTVLDSNTSSVTKLRSYIQGSTNFTRHALFSGRAALRRLGLIIRLLNIRAHAPARHAMRSCETKVADFNAAARV